MDFLTIYSILLLVGWSFNSVSCASQNLLVPGKPLYANHTLISDNGVFALGFFSKSNSTTKHHYVGIWYRNIPDLPVVWVANRGIPVMDTTAAKLTLTSDSDLVLSNTDGHVLWTTNISRNSLPTTGANAILDNTGNFILKSSIDGTVLWQSFDYPTDTLLPGMNFRISHEKHALQHLTPWKGPQDPSPGSFSYGADPNSFFQRFIWNGSRPYRRIPILPSDMNIVPGSDIYLRFHRQDDEIYMSVGSGGSTPVLLKMDYSGALKFLVWVSSNSKWIALVTEPPEPEVQCNTYGYCGPSGYCDNTEHIPTCMCLSGFEPNNKEEWASGKFSQGCVRMEPISCGHRDGFLTLTGMKLPDKFLYVRNRSFDECVAECSSNCSCVAYAYANISTRALNGDDSVCLIWMGELIDTERLTENGQDLYVRLNGLSGSKRKSNVLEIALLVPASLLTLVCLWLVWIRTCRCGTRAKQRRMKFWKREMQGDLSVSDELGDGEQEFPFLRFKEIAVATNNFADSNMLGQGGFGNVYKGMLEGGTEIAVKRLSKSSGQGIVEFRNEVILIAKLQHRSLVKLLGCCIHGDEKLLVYEYLPNKSLDAFLFNDARKSVLDWPTRFKIIKGVARGLLYLHQDSRLRIIHRDLKASNILLDADMSPKISDFGMAKIFGNDQQHANTNRVVGTYGYMSPEYALEGAFSVKSDVYSFGVLLLEIVSGIKISSTHQLLADFPNLKAYAWSLWNDGNTKHLVDPLILESCSLDEVLLCIHVGLLSVQDDPNDRPLMSSIVFILENGATALPAPKQPIYYAQRNHDSENVGENIEHSVNGMSLTALEGR